MNINTQEYWQERFQSGDWEAKSGRRQTVDFAESVVPYLDIAPDFAGTILDFGCGLGDAIPVYRERYPHAQFIGVDMTSAAIAKCNARYGDVATFLQCDHTQIPDVDVIISCAVFEHLSDQKEIAKELLTKCDDLYLIVPYKERLRPGSEHVNTYDDHSFRDFQKQSQVVFLSKGWSERGVRLLVDVYLKNLARPFFRKPIVRRKRMIMYHLQGERSGVLASSRQSIASSRPYGMCTKIVTSKPPQAVLGDEIAGRK